VGALLDALPPGGTLASDIAREQMLLDYVQKGYATWGSWQDVTWAENGHTVIFRVLPDGVKIEGVRIDASATLTQLIADELEAILPTAKMCDIIWQKAPIKLAPLTRQITSRTSAMIDESNRIDMAIGERRGLVGNLGKYWCLSNKLLEDSPGCGGTFPPVKVPDVAANYGWYVKSGSSAAASGNLRVIQPLSRCHNRFHTDYSQLCQLVAQQAVLDGQSVDIRDILTGETSIASLLSSEGTLKTVRQPGADLGWPNAPPTAPEAVASSGGPAAPSGGGNDTFGKMLLYTFAGGVATAVAYKVVQTWG
jgi:hypothetical protein